MADFNCTDRRAKPGNQEHATFIIVGTAFALSAVAGCSSTPNEPSLTLDTQKSPEAYTACLVPKLEENAFRPTLSQSDRHYKIVMPSAVAADNVIEAYKASSGGKVFVYQRSLLAHGLLQAARDYV